jgi:hypothetical protein
VDEEIDVGVAHRAVDVQVLEPHVPAHPAPREQRVDVPLIRPELVVHVPAT